MSGGGIGGEMGMRDRGKPQCQLKIRFTCRCFDGIMLNYHWKTYKRNDYITITISMLPGTNAIWSNGTKITGSLTPVSCIRQPLQDQDQPILPKNSYTSTVTTLTTLHFIDATNSNRVKIDDRPWNDDGGRLSGTEHIISGHMESF